jgi:FG-GAP-like repeat
VADNELCTELGSGTGSFTAGPCSPGGGGGNRGLAAADLNGDGKLDLLTYGWNGYVNLQLGNGDGTFQAPESLALSGTSQGVVLADVNLDGKPDIVVATSSGVAVFLNLGNGSFTSASYYLSGSVQTVAVADLNGDGLPDIAAGLSPGISILFGTGGGAFGTGPSLSLPTHKPHGAGSIALAKFYGDGSVDILACTYFFPGIAQAYLFKGTGGGAFAPAQILTLPGVGVYVTAGDVNGDGIPDFVAITGNVKTVAVFLGKGGGTFAAPRLYAIKPDSGPAVLAPLRKRGLLDMAFASVGSYGITVFLNRGNGTYVDAIDEAVGGGGTLAVADFNEDGKPDVAVQSSSGVTLLLGTGNARQPFQSGTRVSLPANFIAAGDFNSDGHPDLAVDLTNGNIAVLLGDGKGGFSAPILSPAGVIATYIFAADLNGDGNLDLVTAYGTVLYGNGDGTFQAPVTIFPGTTDIWWVASGDFNGDGKTDLAFITGPGFRAVTIFLNQGNGQFEILPAYNLPNYGQTIATGDFNHDGKMDLVVGEWYGIYILLGHGDGTFQQPVEYKLPYVNAAFGVTVGDFNGDGKQDVALATDSNCDVNVFLGNGDGTFQIPTSAWGTGLSDQIIVSGQFQGQQPGHDDIIVSSADGVDVLLNAIR